MCRWLISRRVPGFYGMSHDDDPVSERLTPPFSPQQVRGLFDLTGRVAVVTGAGGVLGGALARSLAVRGAHVAITDLSLSSLDGVLADIEALGRKSFATACDVTDEPAVRRLMDEIVDQMSCIDILVTAAGIANRFPAEDFPVEQWERVMRVNVRGTFLCCQAAGRHMIRGGRGKIVTIGSVRGFIGSPGGNTGYATSKGAVHALTRQLATEWARHQINVNSIAPAVFATPLTRDILQSPESSEHVVSRIPWGRIGEVSDMVGAVLFLASPASDFVTGAILSVDGGTVAS
jgi:NAD(P)-dependent dehydrogenase (short-subunit alcohol dehydrogenase family)